MRIVVRVVGLKYHQYHLVKNDIHTNEILTIRQNRYLGDIGIAVFYRNFLIGHVASEFKEVCFFCNEIRYLSYEKYFLQEPFLRCELLT